MADEKKHTDMHTFGYLLAGAMGFGLGYVFFQKRAFAGGMAERRHFSYDDVPRRELEMGTEVEMEHTTLRPIAKRIALDHLAEDPDYYNKRKMFNREDFE